MKIKRNLLHLGNSNCDGKKTIDRSSQVVNRNGIRESNGRNLGYSMDTGIGAARAIHPHWTALNLRNDRFKDALDCVKTWLNLPTVKIGTVVSNLESQTAGGTRRSDCDWITGRQRG
jgi:hypothetical protein